MTGFGMYSQSKLESIGRHCQFMLMQGFKEILCEITAPQESQEMFLGQITIFQQSAENLGGGILHQSKELIPFGQQRALQTLHQFRGEDRLWGRNFRHTLFLTCDYSAQRNQ